MLDLLTTPKAAKLSTAAAGDATLAARPAGMVLVPLGRILDNPYQPRTMYDADHILNLALSIKRMKGELAATKGLQQVPMARVFHQSPHDGDMVMAGREMYINGTVTRLLDKPNGLVQLMFGHSRLRAFMVLAEGLRSLGQGAAIGMDFSAVTELETRFVELLDADSDYAEMPIMPGFALDHAMWSHAITENSQRKNITAIEEAASIQRAIDEFGLKVEEAGQPFGYARSTTANKLRLLQLPAEVRTAISDGQLTERHGRELVRLVDAPDKLKAAAKLAVDKAMTVRRLTEHVDWEEKDLKAAQEKARQLDVVRRLLAAGWCLPGQDTPVTPDRVVEIESWRFNEFDCDDPLDMALLERGDCGLHCPCLAVGHSEHRGQRGIRPDPKGAPHVCLACTGGKFDKRQALRAAGIGEDSERRRVQAERERKVEALNHAAQVHWQQWLREQDRHALWNSLAFWREAAKATNYYGMERAFHEAPDVQGACDMLLDAVYRRISIWDKDLGESVYTVEAVQALIDRLEGVSRETEELNLDI